MIALKTIQPSLTPNQHSLFCKSRRLAKTRAPTILTLCSKSEDEEDSDSEAKQTPGDAKKQELLARIAMLQTEKVRLTDYLDDRSDYLTKFAEEANTEFDKIGQEALKELEESNARRMKSIESEMQAFEESAELNKQEIEQSDRKLAEFEDQVIKDLNQGLFFKNLGQQSKPVDKAKAQEETKKIEDVTKKSAGSKTRRNIYLALIALLVSGIADSFVSSSPDWRKVAVLGAILVPLITQFASEQEMISESEEKEKKRSEEETK